MKQTIFDKIFKNKYLAALIDCYVHEWNGDEIVFSTLIYMIHDKRLTFSKKAFDVAIKTGNLEMAMLLSDFRTEGYTKSSTHYDRNFVTYKNYEIFNYLQKKINDVLLFYTKQTIHNIDTSLWETQCKLETLYNILAGNASLSYGTSFHGCNSEFLIFCKFFSKMIYMEPQCYIQKCTELKNKCLTVIDEIQAKTRDFKKYILVDTFDLHRDLSLKENCNEDIRKLFSVLVFVHGTHFGVLMKGEYGPSGGTYPNIDGIHFDNINFFEIQKILQEKCNSEFVKKFLSITNDKL